MSFEQADSPQERPEPLHAVLDRIAETSGPRTGPMADFARSYLHRLTQDGPTSADALYHEVAGLYQLIEHRTGAITVRAFNPTMASNGYEASGAVVEVHVDDSPFLVDSIVNELQARDLQVTRVLHPVIGVERDDQGRLIEMRPARISQRRESVQHYVLDRPLPETVLADLEGALTEVLADVQLAVRDFEPMVDRISRMVELASSVVGHYPDHEIEEAMAFLEWLREDNFVFLGYREYRLFETSGGKAVQRVEDSGLGILSDPERSKVRRPVLLSSLSPELAARYEKGDLIAISKTNRLATVHRRAKMDYIGVRILGPEGETAGEARLLGLFTSKAYMERASRTPVLSGKLEHIAGAEDLIQGSHDHKAVVELFESFPKDELFGVPADDLRVLLMGLLRVQERARVKLFVRRELLDRSVRVLVAMPRDRYSGALARSLQDLFLHRFGGKSVDYHLNLRMSGLAHLHFRVWVEEGQVPDVAYEKLDAEVRELTRSWPDRVSDVLATRHGRPRARAMVEAWASRFPAYYASSTELEVAAGDIARLDELLEGEHDLVVGLQNESDGPDPLTRVAFYGRERIRELSELTPALEELGLRVVEEVATRLSGEGDLFIHDFGVLGPDGEQLDLAECDERVAAALTAVWKGEAETDSLNRLVLAGGLDHHQLEILRGYRTYWRRVSPTFTVNYVNDTLVAYADITARLMRLFELRFRPGSDEPEFEELHYELSGQLDAVPSLDQDRILRGFLLLIEATVRTNAYQAGRRSLAFKLRSTDVPDMPAPTPHVEIFVIGTDVEGIHLRAGPVARGGIRWSDRREDYRTEVLGLLKAQVTKNVAIVPTGAKGGFVLRRPPADPGDLSSAVRAAYQIFIRGLLDVTDNLVGGEVAHPEGVRVHDGDDPYLVVAADRGTTTFSDIANDIARERDFWLDDAFASGGSTGYDHKALGITARGAWRSLERHLIDLGIDPHRDQFTLVGIGDMSGDVFGNGMLGSQTMKLLAAFDHRHIFLDPDPDPILSFGERQRLFTLPTSSWVDYEQALISEGGGVYPRSAKKIELSEQAKRALGTESDTVTPAKLIRIILCAPVDVLWNGGIGTYVKATGEPNEEVDDRSNDALRVNGSDLRCQAAVEGGNLGFTQAGRIEYAEQGGKVNTDFIDNSGGVNCSDREVNLKILLRLAQQRGEIEASERDRLLSNAADDVVDRILRDNRGQAQILGLEERSSPPRMDAYEQLMNNLEQEGLLKREMEGLPSSEEMSNRARARTGMSRPELGVLLAYAKRSLVNALLASDLPDSVDPAANLVDYFPRKVSERFSHLLSQHPLRRELIATVIANEVINAQGSTFISRLVARTGAEVSDVVSSFRTADRVAGGTARREAIEELLGVVDPGVRAEMLSTNNRLVSTMTRWYLRDGPGEAEQTDQWAQQFHELEEKGLTLGPPQWQTERDTEAQRLEAAAVPQQLAQGMALLPDLIHAPNIIDLAQESRRPVTDVGRVFFRVGQALQLDALEKVLGRMAAVSVWQRWALQTIDDDLIAVRRLLAERVLAEGAESSSEDAVDLFLAERAHSLARLSRMVQRVESGADDELAALMVAVRQVGGLASEPHLG